MKETDSIVLEVLEQLVAHFGESIHAEVIFNSYSTDATTIPLLSSTTNGSKKDQLKQQERSTPPIVQLWLDRLLSLGLESQGPKLVQELTACDGTTGSNDTETIATVLCEWICGYEKFMRPRLFQATSTSVAFDSMPTFDEKSVPILKNFELVLTKLLLKSIDTEERQSGTPRNPPLDSKWNLLRVTKLLCTDITLLTAITNDNDEKKKNAKNHLRRNEVLPTLLQILGNTLEILRQDVSAMFQINDSHPTKAQFQQFLSECLSSLRLCAVTVLAFDLLDDCNDDGALASVSSQSSDLTLVRRILERTKLSTTDTSCEISATAANYLEKALGDDSLFYNDINDDYWSLLLSTTSQSSLLSTGWIDCNPNNARGTLRIVHGIWRSMEALLTVLSKLQGKIQDLVKDNSINEDVRIVMTHQERRALVLEKLGGAGPMLGDVRAHFFGRNLHGMEDLRQQKVKSNDVAGMELSSVVIKMGRRVAKTNKSPNAEGTQNESPIFERFPSRIAAALNAFRTLITPKTIEQLNHAHTENILQNVFPVCAALIDSNDAEFGTLGAAGLLKVIDALVPRKVGMAPKDAVPNDYTLIIHSEAWRNFTENTLAVLERSLQTNRDHGHVVIAIGRLQNRLFEIMLSEAMENTNVNQKQTTVGDIGERFRQRRRMATEQWLLKLERSLYRPVAERQHLELLLGGVIPLLTQHAMDEKSEADGMELGRLGLAALLPITTKTTTTGDMTTESGGDNVGIKAQMAAMVALINLIFAAHPIISGHGGKIMSHLLTAAASTSPIDKDESNSESDEGDLQENSPSLDSIRNMAILVAAIVVVICDHKSVHQILHGIEEDRDQFKKSMFIVVTEVRGLAIELKAMVN